MTEIGKMIRDEAIKEMKDSDNFGEFVKFKYPTHQISLHTARALSCLKFEGSY